MAKLINGNGNPAIYAAEDADLIASLAGNVTCIANVGNKYAATEEDATTIRLDDGVIITKEGRRIQLKAGESDTFYIPTGTSGQTNYYIIGYKLVQNADSTQGAEQFVQKMNSSSETITEDTFRSGATEVYVSVYRVTQVGFTIDSISGLLPELLDNASIKDNIDQINSDLNKYHRRVAYYMNTTNKTYAQCLTEICDQLNALQLDDEQVANLCLEEGLETSSFNLYRCVRHNKATGYYCFVGFNAGGNASLIYNGHTTASGVASTVKENTLATGTYNDVSSATNSNEWRVYV